MESIVEVNGKRYMQSATQRGDYTIIDRRPILTDEERKKAETDAARKLLAWMAMVGLI